MKREWWAGGVFDADMAEVNFPPEKIAEAKAEVKGLRSRLGLKPGMAVLDAACGVGRHSLELARQGLLVTGVDYSRDYVKRAQASARRERLKGAAFESGDLRDLWRFHGSFDAVINLYTSFGYYARAKDNLEALRQMAGALKPGGVLALELLPRESLQKIFVAKDWHRTSDGYMMFKREWIHGGRQMRGEVVTVRQGRAHEHVTELWVYTVHELESMLRRVGLERVRIWGGYKGQKWAPGRRLLIAGWKSS